MLMKVPSKRLDWVSSVEEFTVKTKIELSKPFDTRLFLESNHIMFFKFVSRTPDNFHRASLYLEPQVV
jgi:hypothetical protein